MPYKKRNSLLSTEKKLKYDFAWCRYDSHHIPVWGVQPYPNSLNPDHGPGFLLNLDRAIRIQTNVIIAKTVKLLVNIFCQNMIILACLESGSSSTDSIDSGSNPIPDSRTLLKTEQ
jgi:hypothetical protein